MLTIGESTPAVSQVPPSPGDGAASVVSRPDGGDEVWIAYTDNVTPTRILHYSVARGELTPWAETPGAPDTSRITSRQVFVTSKDDSSQYATIHLLVQS